MFTNLPTAQQAGPISRIVRGIRLGGFHLGRGLFGGPARPVSLPRTSPGGDAASNPRGPVDSILVRPQVPH